MDKIKIYNGTTKNWKTPKKAFITIVAVCTCLFLVPLYTVWEQTDVRQHFNYITSAYWTPLANETSYVTRNPFEILNWTKSSDPIPLPNSTITLLSTSQPHVTSIIKVPSQLSKLLVNDQFSLTNSTVKSERYPPPSRLTNITDFEYMVNPEVCLDNDEVFMLVIVGSHPRNVLAREAIRKTWGNPNITDYPFKLIFVFGKFVEPIVQSMLNVEVNLYGDIVQGNFMDSYHNVTARDMMGIRWAWNYCPQAKYIMRADDDISINIFVLNDILERKFGDYRAKNKSLLACFAKFIDGEVLRTGNYAVSKDDHKADRYEPYCSGWMYVLNPRMAKELDMAGLRIKPYWMNDAYITGTLSAAVGVPLQDLEISFTYNNLDMIAMDVPSSRYSVSKPLMKPRQFVLGYVGNNVTLIRNLHELYKREYYRNSKINLK